MATKRAVIIGAGPNGLTAAAVLARAGLQVEVFEANSTIGGAASTAELTLPGFHHDVGSSAFPMGAASPIFRSLGLEQYGLTWLHPEFPLAHPLDNAQAVILHRSVAETAEQLGTHDAAAYRQLMQPLVDAWEELAPELLGPPIHLPRHPLLLARFGIDALQSAQLLAERLFHDEPARALLAGMAGHAVLPLEYPTSAAIALVLGVASHAVGWPVAAGGAQAISDALAACLRASGGTLHTGIRVQSLAEVGPADLILCDLTPTGLLAIARNKDGQSDLTPSFANLLRRFRRGPGIFKVDWALSGPIPWANPAARRAGSVHVGGTLAEIAASERSTWNTTAATWPGPANGNARPYLILVQPSVIDPSRAPVAAAGNEQSGHTAWAYCHVPNGWRGDATAAIEQQIERFAPGFPDRILARHTMGTAALEAWNANLLGGDVSGGAMTPWQVAVRPTPRLYNTSNPALFLCSSSTPPGGGVHGMCGYHAARAALRSLRP